MQQSITPNLWFDGNAKDAVDYYVSIFPNSKIISTSYYPEDEEGAPPELKNQMAGEELVIEYELNGMQFMAINGGPQYRFNESISFAIFCKDQEEIDYYWGYLSSVPESEQCGWCKDQFGVSWQILPTGMGDLMQRPGANARMMQMKKIIISDL